MAVGRSELTFELRPNDKGKVASVLVALAVMGASVLLGGRVMLVPALLVAITLLGLAALARAKIFFRPDRMEYVSPMGGWIIHRQEILGWRTEGGVLFLEFRDRTRDPISISWVDMDDSRLRSWLGEIPKFDAAEAVLQSMGGVREERLGDLAAAKRVVLVIDLVAGAASIWFLLTGHVIPALALVVLPFLACFAFARSGGLIRVHRDYPNAMGAVLASAFLLFLRTASSATNAGYYLDLVPLTAIIGGVFCLALAKTVLVEGPRWPAVPGLLLLGLFYGYGAGMQLNTLLDTSPPTVYRAEILKKYIYHGKRTVHKLRLGAWGTRRAGWGVAVDPGLWEAWKPGDLVCIQTRAGALGVEWFDNNGIQPCK